MRGVADRFFASWQIKTATLRLRQRMDELTTAYYEERFNNLFHGTHGDSFQALFSKVMALAHPADFIACRPWGNLGDRKSADDAPNFIHTNAREAVLLDVCDR